MPSCFNCEFSDPSADTWCTYEHGCFKVDANMHKHKCPLCGVPMPYPDVLCDVCERQAITVVGVCECCEKDVPLELFQGHMLCYQCVEDLLGPGENASIGFE